MQPNTVMKIVLMVLGLAVACALPFMGLERFENDQAPLLVAFGILALSGALLVHLRWPHATEMYISGAVMVFALLSLMGLVGLLAEMPADSAGLGGMFPVGGP